MSRTLYLECYAGISGDMTVGALIDLGANVDVLKKALNSIPISGYEIKIERKVKSGIDVCDFSVILEKDNHDHDMEFLHGNKEEHGHHHHHHSHRGLNEISDIINRSVISENAKQMAIKIFTIIAQSEAKAHNKDIEEVAFHEVGAIDSIVDIIAVAVCLDDLKITEVIVPNICEGRGMVRCQHGVLPIPVPAVTNIAQMYALDLKLTDVEGELITPTGAAIVAAIKTANNLPESFKIVKTGIGAGKRNYSRPSMVRAMLIEAAQEAKDIIYKLETNIDDCTGENLGFLMELLLEAGARDVNYSPIFMKKNRPAYQLNVLCKKEDVKKLEFIIFKETTTIGIRKSQMERSILKREVITVKTSIGEAEIKVCEVEGDKRFYPEYESVVKICKDKNISYSEVYEILKRESKDKYE